MQRLQAFKFELMPTEDVNMNEKIYLYDTDLPALLEDSGGDLDVAIKKQKAACLKNAEILERLADDLKGIDASRIRVAQEKGRIRIEVAEEDGGGRQ